MILRGTYARRYKRAYEVDDKRIGYEFILITYIEYRFQFNAGKYISNLDF